MGFLTNKDSGVHLLYCGQCIPVFSSFSLSFSHSHYHSPFGEVIEGMEYVDRFYAGYGEGAPSGKGPSQALIQAKGNEYLGSSFPKLSYITKGSFAK